MDNGEPVPVIGSAQEARGSSELPEERKRSLLRRHGLDLIIVLLTGIFGFIAIQIFPNRFFD